MAKYFPPTKLPLLVRSTGCMQKEGIGRALPIGGAQTEVGRARQEGYVPCHLPQ